MRHRRVRRSTPATRILLEGLARLEYRGYDSAGITIAHRKALRTTRAAGRVDDLRARIEAGAAGATGIAHTRWATHGEPSEPTRTRTPTPSGRIAVVHNGIVENADELRAKLHRRRRDPRRDTDTEVLAPPHRARAAETTGRSRRPSATALRAVEGTYGLVVLDAAPPDELVVARNGSPIVLGLGEGEMFVASDVAALVRHTRQVVFLEDGEIATVTRRRVRGLTARVAQTVERRRGRLRARRVPRLHRKEIPSSPRRCAGRCGAGWTPGSPPRASAGCGSTPAICATCGG